MSHSPSFGGLYGALDRRPLGAPRRYAAPLMAAKNDKHDLNPRAKHLPYLELIQIQVPSQKVLGPSWHLHNGVSNHLLRRYLDP